MGIIHWILIGFEAILEKKVLEEKIRILIFLEVKRSSVLWHAMADQAT